MKTLRTFKAELLADTNTRAHYDAMAGEYGMARELIAARSRAGLTQLDVAQRMGTTQSTIAVFAPDWPPSLPVAMSCSLAWSICWPVRVMPV